VELLKIEHKGEFTLWIECGYYSELRQKSFNNLQKEQLSTYTWSDPLAVATFFPENMQAHPLANGQPDTAIFFDNADYAVWVEFAESVKWAKFVSERKDVNDRFTYREKKHVLTGFLNYGNDIGKSDIRFEYTIDGQHKQFAFSYEVLSTKLDYHEHWNTIIRDIEEEYRMLSLDYLRKTYHGISISNQEEKSFDIIWWNIFKGVQEEFIAAIRAILARPRHKLRPTEIYQRADAIRHFTPALEQQFSEHRTEDAHLYRVEVQTNSNNTLENRFLKATLQFVESNYARIERQIQGLKLLSDSERSHIASTGNTLRMLLRDPFFRTVGKFEGIRQESLVLQKDVYYSKVYRTSILLRKSFSLNDGMYKMETKDIATLYEIWCFIRVAKIVRETLGVNTTADQRNRTEMNGLFTYELGQGEHSSIIFHRDGVELAELVYNPKHQDESKDDIRGIGNMVSKTVNQKPDIVLQLTKDDVQSGMHLTYLFDAKYRIKENRSAGNDAPPDDAINQMHRYRDAIFYQQNRGDLLKREVLGGYILFPGVVPDAQKAKFIQSVDEVGIGAFPLRPNDETSDTLLREFIARIVAKDAESSLSDQTVIPQKGLQYTFGVAQANNIVLVNYIRRVNMSATIDQGLTYVRAGEVAGSLTLRPEALSAKFVLIHDGKLGTLYPLHHSAPRIATQEELSQLGFETHHPYYLLFKFNPSEPICQFSTTDNFHRYKNIEPFFIPLKELQALAT